MTASPRRWRTSVGVAAVALAALAPPAQGDPLPASKDFPVDCLGGQSGDGEFSPLTTTGKNKKQSTVVGSFSTSWTLEAPSCAGVEYVLTLTAHDADATDGVGAPSLAGWTTTTASWEPGGADVVSATAPASDGSVRISFTGTGVTTFIVAGTTGSAYTARCIDGAVDMLVGGEVVGEPATFQRCDGLPPGGSSYY